MLHSPKGTPVHGEFSSSDASALTEANSRFSLYAPGKTSALTLASTDWTAVYSLFICVGAAMTITVYSGPDNSPDAGELIAKVVFGAAGSQVIYLAVPVFCLQGTWPKLKASVSGQVDAILAGLISSAAP